MVARLSGLLILLAVQVKTETCSAPSGHTGECIQMGDCPGLIDIFANYANGTEELLNQFFCKHHYVCCPSHWQSTVYNQFQAPAPQRFCGWQRVDDDIPSTTDISLDEFPWLAALISEDKINRKKEILCQGTLISHSYVITAAHCTLNQKYPVSAVRLGEFNIKNSTDCRIIFDGQSVECNIAEDHAIEEIITHHFYSSETGQNDIALIRITTRVMYSDFIRSICLPTPDMTSIRPGDTLYATGWGKTSTGNKSELKKKIRTTLIGNERCQNTLNEFKTTIIITPYNMCTLDEDDSKDFSCIGDGGSPVMFTYRGQWYLEGIISAGIGCGRKVPDVQTKVVRYLNWINYNLKP